MADKRIFSDEFYEDVIKYIMNKIIEEFSKDLENFGVGDEPVNWGDIGCSKVVLVGEDRDLAYVTVEEASPHAIVFASELDNAYTAALLELLDEIELDIHTEW